MRLKTIKYLLLLVSLLISIVANAYDFEVGGIYYNKDGNCAIVTRGNSYYSGDVSIPSTVNYGGMEYSVTSIGEYAFFGCTGLTSVTIPNSVTSIGDYAFQSCSGLTSVTIPNSVTRIGDWAFFGCEGLTSIKVESGNPIYDSRNDCNAIIRTASNTLVAGCKNTVIPNSVTSIGDDAFFGCSGLTSVTIPSSVTSIGNFAFANCDGLTSIKVESGNTTYDSRNDCNAIIETASNTLVAGCKNTIIPNSVTSIGYGAFFGCTGLTSVTIPNSVTSIGGGAFGSCSGLTSVTIGNSVTSIGINAFNDCRNLKSVISEIEIPFTIDSSVFDSDTETNGQLTVPKGKKSVYQSTDGWKEFSNIVEVISSYTLTIQSSSGGYVSYNGANISATTKTFTIDEGSSVTFTITPNTGYYLSKLTVNGTDVTTSVSNNQYTISNITANTSVVATFEKIVTGIDVNATNFPDENFRTYIFEMVEGADDAILTDEEIAKVTDIDCSAPSEDLKIYSLKGIEFFSALKRLVCADNRLTSLDVSKNQALTSLYCSNNQLTSLDISKNPVLTSLACHNNQLTSLDVSNTALTILDCGLNQLTSLDVSKNTALTELDCSYNQLATLDVSNNTALTSLICRRNQLTTLDVSKNTALTELSCSSNQLAALDLTKNTALKILYCESNQLTTLNVSNNTAMTSFDCSSNKLTSLDVSTNTALTSLSCYSNQLTSLDLRKNTALKDLNCYGNQLTSLDVSGCTALTDLYCPFNQLTTLDVSNNTKLTFLGCDNNQLTTLDLSKNTALNHLVCSYNHLLYLNLEGGKISEAKSSITPQMATLTAKNVSEGIAIPVPTDFDFTKVSNLKLAGASVSGSITNADSQKYLVFAQPNTAQSSIDGEKLTYTYSTGNKYSPAASMDVTVTLSYTDPAPTGIEVNATNFPDEAFRNWVLQNVSGASDGMLTDDEIGKTTSINCSSKSISNLQGIEFLTALTTLNCSGNKLSSLDVSKNTALKKLSCQNNKLVSLDVSGCTAITEIECFSNQLTSLDVSKNTALTSLNCNSNQLASLDVSRNAALVNLYCGSNQLTSLDISNNTALKELNCQINSITNLSGLSADLALTLLICDRNQLKTLDVSRNTALTRLYCHTNQFTSLNVNRNTALTLLYCYNNQLTTLDLSKNTVLESLYCDDNQLSKLDVTNNTALKELSIDNNRLTSLDVTKNTALTLLSCVNNLLTNLDVSRNTALSSFWCNNNQLTVLDVSRNTKLTRLDCYGNQLRCLNLGTNTSINDASTSISPQSAALSAQNISEGIAIPVPSDFDYSKVSNLKLGGASVTGSVVTVNGQKYLVFAKTGTAESAINGKMLTYTYNTGNSFNKASSVDVTLTLSYTAVTYSLSIQSRNGGSVTYNGTTVKNTTQTFTVNEGVSATITITPDSGYRLASLTVNGTNVTSSVKNNQYTISNITTNTTVVATFEEIPATTFSLSIQSGTGGSVSYDGTTITNKTQSFVVTEGTSATITITPNTGYKLSKLTVNGTNVTSSVSNNKYTINSISANTTVVVTFEQITYSLSVQATGNGTVTYNSTATKNTTNSFTVNHGSSATLSISPDNGYRLASLKVNGTNVTSSVSNNQYTIGNITANTTVVATFEQIPVTTYSLSIQSGAGGSVSYDGTTITNKTQSFTIAEGSSATITVSPNSGYKLASLVVNGTDVTSGVVNNQYTISNITANTTVVVTFKAIPQTISVDGINYEVRSAADYTLNVGKSNYSGHVVIPATVTYDGDTWMVAGVVDGAFNQSAITAITWNPNTAIGDGAFGAQTNPNLLLYVKDAAYAPENVQNVIANRRARKIVLTDAASGNDFNCPEAFTAEEISYTHCYSMTTGIGECRGWETIALPFDVKQFTHESKGTLIPFKVYSSTTAGKPFWLYRLTATGWQEAANIEANTPYIISLPNNKVYDNDYNLPGVMTFSSSNVTVPVTEVVRSTYGDRTFVANFTSQASSWSIYALNVNNDYSTYSDYLPEGSTFIRELRTVHPFEAYMTNSSGNAKQFLPLFETLPTAIREIPMQAMRGMKGVRIYSMSGELIMFDQNISIEEALKQLKRGVYFVNGKKMVVK